MTGAIPKYGKHFRITNREYHPTMASRRYTLKADSRYYIQSDKRSKEWHVYGKFGEMGPVQPTLTRAMEALLSVYDQPSDNLAIHELAHIARNLCARLVEIDSEFPGSMQQAISNKIEFYANERQSNG